MRHQLSTDSDAGYRRNDHRCFLTGHPNLTLGNDSFRVVRTTAIFETLTSLHDIRFECVDVTVVAVTMWARVTGGTLWILHNKIPKTEFLVCVSIRLIRLHDTVLVYTSILIDSQPIRQGCSLSRVALESIPGTWQWPQTGFHPYPLQMGFPILMGDQCTHLLNYNHDDVSRWFYLSYTFNRAVISSTASCGRYSSVRLKTAFKFSRLRLNFNRENFILYRKNTWEVSPNIMFKGFISILYFKPALMVSIHDEDVHLWYSLYGNIRSNTTTSSPDFSFAIDYQYSDSSDILTPNNVTDDGRDNGGNDFI